VSMSGRIAAANSQSYKYISLETLSRTSPADLMRRQGCHKKDMRFLHDHRDLGKICIDQSYVYVPSPNLFGNEIEASSNTIAYSL
jgi:hypothetical protein